jgi:hypothetical protein
MSSAGGLSLPVHVAKSDQGSWTSGVSLYKVIWAVKRCCMSSSVLHAVPGRAALAMRLGGLDLRDLGEGGSLGAPSGDERIQDWIVLSVRSGWTPNKVLLWVFPCFGGMLFDLARDESGSARSLCRVFIICNLSCCSGEISCLRLGYPFVCAFCMCMLLVLRVSGSSVAVATR